MAEPSAVTSGVLFRAARDFERASRALSMLGRRVHVWVPECGAGEDAWSLAMLVAEAALPARIVASDGDPELLARAGHAVYLDAQLRHVGAARRRRHLVRGLGPRQGLWRVVAPLRDQVELLELDLRGAWPPLGSFDLIWAHGAFATLEPSARAPRVRRLAELLAPGGLLLGAPVDDARDEAQRAG